MINLRVLRAFFSGMYKIHRTCTTRFQGVVISITFIFFICLSAIEFVARLACWIRSHCKFWRFRHYLQFVDTVREFGYKNEDVNMST